MHEGESVRGLEDWCENTRVQRDRWEWGNRLGVNLLSVAGKIYGRVMLDRIWELITGGWIGEEQGEV